jgi:hypothetical protein
MKVKKLLGRRERKRERERDGWGWRENFFKDEE